MNVYRRNGHRRIGSVDQSGTVYLNGGLWRGRRVGRTSRHGEIFRRGLVLESKVGTVDREGYLFRAGTIFRGERVGLLDRHGNIYLQGTFLRGRRIGRIRPAPTNHEERVHAAGAAFLLFLDGSD